MKNIITLILGVFLLNSCQAPTVSQERVSITEDEKQIAKDLIQGAFDDLWAGVDSSKISNYHTEDFVILENGEVWDNERIKKYMHKKLAELDRPKRTNRMEYLSIDKYGESMQIAYYNFAEFTEADSLIGKAKWLESALAVPTANGWRLKMMHSTWAGN